jgi:hypothetical protein
MNQIITSKTKRGRKNVPDHLRVKLISAYLRPEEKQFITDNFGTASNALRQLITYTKMQTNAKKQSPEAR